MWDDLLRGAIESSTTQLVVCRDGAEIWSLPGQNGDPGSRLVVARLRGWDDQVDDPGGMVHRVAGHRGESLTRSAARS